MAHRVRVRVGIRFRVGVTFWANGDSDRMGIMTEWDRG